MNEQTKQEEIVNDQVTIQEEDIAQDQVDNLEDEESENEQDQTDENEQDQADEAQDQEEEADEEDESDDYEDAEYEGKTYRLPKELKDALLRQKDYTKKTQGVAKEREDVVKLEEAYKEQRAKFDEEQKLLQENFQANAQLFNIDNQLKQFDGFNWQQYSEANGSEASMNLQMQYNQLLNTKTKLQNDISITRQKHSTAQQQQLLRMEQDAQAVLQRDIKNWGTEKQNNLVDYAVKQGVDKESINNAIKYDSTAIKILEKASKYDQLMKQSTSKKKTVVKPIKSKIIKNAKAVSNLPSESDNMESWAAKRREEKRKKGIR